jgi:hypothetical protein
LRTAGTGQLRPSAGRRRIDIGVFYFKVADPLLMSAIFRAYNDWLADPRNARKAAVRAAAPIPPD